MSGEKTVWAFRNPYLVGVVLTHFKPKWRPRSNCYVYKFTKPMAVATLRDFEFLTGLKVDPGEAVQLRLSVEVIQRLKGGEG